MIQTVNVTSAVIVTTPQEVAIVDARKALSMFRLDTINVPILGIVENMAYFTPAELPENKYYLFGKEGGKKLADEYELPLLAQIPLVQSVREGGDAGKPIMMTDDVNNPAYKAFEELGVNVARQIAIVNAEKEVAA
jgi:ATP-binding protein involved in chromosome partitioning